MRLLEPNMEKSTRSMEFYNKNFRIDSGIRFHITNSHLQSATAPWKRKKIEQLIFAESVLL